MSSIKWGRVALWSVLGFIIFLLIPILYVTVRMFILGFQLGGNPGQEAQIEFSTNTAYRVVSLLAMVLGGFLGGRAPARKAEDSYVLNGLLAGIGLTIIFLVFLVVTRSSFNFWVPVYALLGIAASALGGWLGGRAAEAEAYD